MKVSIRQRNLELPEELRRDIDRRVRFAMSRPELDAIVIYSEFYSRSLQRALSLVAGKTFTFWVTPAGPFKGYLPLLESPWVDKLGEAIKLVEDQRWAG